MQGYIDSSFNCEHHPNSKRIKAVSWNVVKAHEIRDVVIGPLLDVEPNTPFIVIPGCPLKPLHRFVYTTADKTITVPLITDHQFFINSNMVLFTLSSTSVNIIWNIMAEEDIYYSDEDEGDENEDQVDEDEDDVDGDQDDEDDEDENKGDEDEGADQVDADIDNYADVKKQEE